ncbi:MAG: hypothetical protein KC656_07740 [Myxococcales bacterium]|nr:hypothetical protein [Myxococcales bacterium]MCB9673132.1 hypothetical protein [Alphaproteobacteria bacterium]
MGLGISVGILADLNRNDPEGAAYFRDQLEVLNRYLTDQMLPLHLEPESLPPLARTTCTSFPYSFLHYLRRIYARARQDPAWSATPCARDEDPALDPAVDEETFMFTSHLLCHSDAEGFYLPVDFTELITGDDVLGGFAGSTHRLQEELVVCAHALGIHLDHDQLVEGEAERLDRLSTDGPFFREITVWLALWEAVGISLEHNTAIAFT